MNVSVDRVDGELLAVRRCGGAVPANLSWLKIVAMVAMVFDHAAVGILRAHDSDVFGSCWRLPGRLSMPIFAFLLAYSYTHFTSNKSRLLGRLWLFAVISEPIYQLYFNESGNALISLAVGVTFLFSNETGNALWKRVLMTISTVALVVILTITLNSVLMWTYAAMVVCFHRFLATRGLGWATALLVAGLLSNRIGVPEAGILLLTLSLIFACAWPLVELPRLRLRTWVGYLFYPAHLLALWLVL